MKKNNLGYFLVQKEGSFLKWLGKNHFKVILVFVFSVLIFSISKLPYFNLFLAKPLDTFFIAAFIIFVWRISIDRVIALSIILLLISMMLLILGIYESAVQLVDMVFGFVIILLIKLIGSDL